jgi:endonuclease YncB( thermonuclease family)
LTCSDPRAFHDGDTFTCEHEAGAVRVRVAGIDAPETGQGFWRVSRDLLRQRAVPGTVVDCYKVDAYERQVCRVTSPTGADISLELVQTGLAWHSRKYAFEQRAEERERYEAAETWARGRGLGLWSQTDPQDPSECRAFKKQRQKCR